jgi:hypothetical protein
LSGARRKPEPCAIALARRGELKLGYVKVNGACALRKLQVMVSVKDLDQWGKAAMSDVRTRANFDIGKVVEQTFTLISRNIVVFGLMAVVLGVLPNVVTTLLNADNIRGMANTTGNPAAQLSAVGKFYSILPIALIAGLALNVGLMAAAGEDLAGRPVDPSTLVVRTLRAILPLIGFFILEMLALMLGFVLLIIPGLMMAIAWSVAAPAIVVEGYGIFGAFSRSADLTRGVRWRVFALFLIYFVINTVITMVGMAIVGGAGAMNFLKPDLAQQLALPTVLYTSIMQGVQAIIVAAGSVVLHHQLKLAREGVSTDQVVDAFS